MSDVFLGLQAAVPFVRTLGLEEVEVSAERAVLRLPDAEGQRNHVGGPLMQQRAQQRLGLG